MMAASIPRRRIEPWPALLAGAIFLCAVVAVLFMHPQALGTGVETAMRHAGIWVLLAGVGPFAVAAALLVRAVLAIPAMAPPDRQATS
jgi:hypothetical protein